MTYSEYIKKNFEGKVGDLFTLGESGVYHFELNRHGGLKNRKITEVGHDYVVVVNTSETILNDFSVIPLSLFCIETNKK